MKVYIINLSRNGFEMALTEVPGGGLINEKTFKEKLAEWGLIENRHYHKSKKCLHTYEVQGVVNTVNVLLSLPQDMIQTGFYTRVDNQPIIYGIIGARYASTITSGEFGSEDITILRRADDFLFQVLKNFVTEHLTTTFSKNASIVQLQDDMRQIEQIRDIDFFDKPRYLLGYCCIYQAWYGEYNKKYSQSICSLLFFRTSPLLKILSDFMSMYQEKFAPSLNQISSEKLRELYLQYCRLANEKKMGCT